MKMRKIERAESIFLYLTTNTFFSCARITIRYQCRLIPLGGVYNIAEFHRHRSMWGVPVDSLLASWGGVGGTQDTGPVATRDPSQDN